MDNVNPGREHRRSVAKARLVALGADGALKAAWEPIATWRDEHLSVLQSLNHHRQGGLKTVDLVEHQSTCHFTRSAR